jgi:spore maturation protein CgeB
MKFVFFYHSLVSDWNHGNAHFLRGVLSELLARGHEVTVYEPGDGWSRQQLLQEQGERALSDFHTAFPLLHSHDYDAGSIDLPRALEGADVVLVHEWNDPELIARIGRAAAAVGCRALFHDTHHRSVTAPQEMERLDLRDYAGVLAFGKAIADRYLQRGWSQLAWVWHEAADTRVFQPLMAQRDGDLVWVGNWGDDERSHELREFLIDPVSALHLRATVYGVRYPEEARAALAAAGITYGGWIANSRVPQVFAQHRCTVHVPRRAYARDLAGIPTIRMFEALACGMPLVCAPWDDAEHLFRPGKDYLVARDGREMRECLLAVLNDNELATQLSASGLETIRSRHTCGHRVDELLRIISGLDAADAATQRRISGGRA